MLLSSSFAAAIGGGRCGALTTPPRMVANRLRANLGNMPLTGLNSLSKVSFVQRKMTKLAPRALQRDDKNPNPLERLREILVHELQFTEQKSLRVISDEAVKRAAHSDVGFDQHVSAVFVHDLVQRHKCTASSLKSLILGDIQGTIARADILEEFMEEIRVLLQSFKITEAAWGMILRRNPAIIALQKPGKGVVYRDTHWWLWVLDKWYYLLRHAGKDEEEGRKLLMGLLTKRIDLLNNFRHETRKLNKEWIKHAAKYNPEFLTSANSKAAKQARASFKLKWFEEQRAAGPPFTDDSKLATGPSADSKPTRLEGKNNISVHGAKQPPNVASKKKKNATNAEIDSSSKPSSFADKRGTKESLEGDKGNTPWSVPSAFTGGPAGNLPSLTPTENSHFFKKLYEWIIEKGPIHLSVAYELMQETLPPDVLEGVKGSVVRQRLLVVKVIAPDKLVDFQTINDVCDDYVILLCKTETAHAKLQSLMAMSTLCGEKLAQVQSCFNLASIADLLTEKLRRQLRTRKVMELPHWKAMMSRYSHLVTRSSLTPLAIAEGLEKDGDALVFKLPEGVVLMVYRDERWLTEVLLSMIKWLIDHFF